MTTGSDDQATRGGHERLRGIVRDGVPRVGDRDAAALASAAIRALTNGAANEVPEQATGWLRWLTLSTSVPTAQTSIHSPRLLYASTSQWPPTDWIEATDRTRSNPAM